MTGTILVALQTYAGVDVRDGKLSINPHLPKHWRGIKFNLKLKGNNFTIEVSQKDVKVKYEGEDEKVVFWVNGEEKKVGKGKQVNVEI